MERLYNVAANESLGRYLVASRNIKQGEIIMKEKPRLLGSQIAGFSICFKCASRIYTPTPPPCEQCGLAPTCGHCRGTLHQQECPYMHKLNEHVSGLTMNFFCENPQVSMPFRCLLMKFYDPSCWEEFLHLESHILKRQGTYIYNLHKYQVDRPLREARIFEALEMDDKEHSELLPTICGILDVNIFEVRPAHNFQGPEDCLRGLYLKPALMAHDCLSNTHLSVDDDFQMTIRASQLIKEGDMITFSYSNGLQGNLDRQKHLEQGKYFTCTCTRCLDPTELGTGLSTLICPKCKNPTLICKKDKWQCPQCAKNYSNSMIRTTLALAKDRVSNVVEYGSLQDAKHLVTMLQQTLHAQHSFIIELNQKIITLLSQEPDIPAMLEKIALCKGLSKVLQVIEPGISRHQGIAQYELHNAQVHLGKVQYNSNRITLDQYLSILRKGEGVLKGAIGHLIYEPKGTPEGRLAQKALTDLQVLRATIKDVGAKVQKKSKKHK